MLIFEGLRQVDAYATPYAAFASRASVVVNHADKVWPPAYELCARLGRRFGQPRQVHVGPELSAAVAAIGSAAPFASCSRS